VIFTTVAFDFSPAHTGQVLLPSLLNPARLRVGARDFGVAIRPGLMRPSARETRGLLRLVDGFLFRRWPAVLYYPVSEVCPGPLHARGPTPLDRRSHVFRGDTGAFLTNGNPCSTGDRCYRGGGCSTSVIPPASWGSGDPGGGVSASAVRGSKGSAQADRVLIDAVRP